MHAEPTGMLREAGLRVTRPRVAVISALVAQPHAPADGVLQRVRAAGPETAGVSTQAVYDVLNTLTERGLVRRIQPAGAGGRGARYELRVGDNHHHLVCRRCGAVTDVDCATEQAPCLDAGDLDGEAAGFVVDEAEVTFWGVCSACARSEKS